MRTRYRRSDFPIDAEWLGLDARKGVSEPDLRRRRDELMNRHHPDRGGSDEMASRINDTYARMSGWLRRRKQRGAASARARDLAEPQRPETVPPGRWMLAGSMVTTALGAVAAWAIVRGRRR